MNKEVNVTDDPELNGSNERTGPKITADIIRDGIGEIDYIHMDNSTLTICILHLKNGIDVVGHSTCVSKENYNRQIGEHMAYDNAFDQCWSMFGFHLASMLSGWTMMQGVDVGS